MLNHPKCSKSIKCRAYTDPT